MFNQQNRRRKIWSKSSCCATRQISRSRCARQTLVHSAPRRVVAAMLGSNKHMECKEVKSSTMGTYMWMEEILDWLIGLIIYRVSTILLVVQDFFLPSTVCYLIHWDICKPFHVITEHTPIYGHVFMRKM